MTSWKCALTFACAAILGATTTASGVFIAPVYVSTFSDSEKDCIKDAVKEWADLLPCNDGFRLDISFVCNNGITALGLTGGWQLTDGRPTAATVTIKNDAHNWTLASPAPGANDALDTLKHEIAHALGFTTSISTFAGSVATVGTNRFYDTDGNGSFNAGDLDLVDDPQDGTHTLSGLMAVSTPLGVRNHPTPELANILHDAYGYCIPEPATALSVLSVLPIFIMRRRERRQT